MVIFKVKLEVKV